MADDVTLGEVNRNVQAMAEDVKLLATYVRVQNGRVSLLETRVSVLEAIGPPPPNKRAVLVVGASAGVGSAVTLLLPLIKKALGL
jgi:NADPH:quinone reductase-like Zn-dependent oxidoreductase